MKIAEKRFLGQISNVQRFQIENITDVPTSLADLANGSQLVIAQANFIESNEASLTTSIFLITGSDQGKTYKLSFSTIPVVTESKSLANFNEQVLPSASVDADCNLAVNENCTITLSSNNAPLGTYYITPELTDSVTGQVIHANPFSYTVTTNDDPRCHHGGRLFIHVNSTKIAHVGDTISGFVGVTDSRYIHDLDVKIYSTKPQESGVASVMPQTCKVSTFKLCPITIMGLESGVISFSIQAIDSDKYKIATSPLIHVSDPIVPGHLSLKVTPSNLAYGAYATADVTLESAVGVTNLVIKFVSLDSGVASIESQCAIISSNDGLNKCNVQLHAGEETGYANIIGYVDNNTYVPVAKVVSVHPLPTSGHLEITLESPEIAYGQSTHAIISLVDSSYVSNFLVNVHSNNSNIAIIDEPGYCQLSSSQTSCEVTVTAKNESGIADITTSAPNYEPVQTTLTVASTPVLGSISITLSSPTIAVESDTIAIIKLNDSAYVNDAVVTVNSEDVNIATPVGTNVCHLTTANNMCEVVIKGSTVGSTNITATSAAYTITPAPIHVITPGYIAMTPSAINLEYGATSTITLTLNGSVGVNNAKVTLTSGDSSIATVSQCSPVDLSSGSATCAATITAGQITGNTTITASLNAGGYMYLPVTTAINITPSPLPGTLSVSAVVVPKNQEVTEIVSLNNSRLVNTPIIVNVVSQNLNVAIPLTTSCTVSSSSPSCSVRVEGKSIGSTNMLASSTGYTTAYGTVKVDLASPIPQQCSSSTSNGFTTTQPFRAIRLMYNFIPAKFQGLSSALKGKVPFYPSYGVLNLDKSVLIGNGWPVVTDASSTNPVIVGSVTKQVIPGVNASGRVDVSACGAAGAWSSASITTDVNLASNGYIHLHMENSSNGDCGNWGTSTFDDNIHVGDSYDRQVYAKNELECGNGNWDIGGYVQVKFVSCYTSGCLYQVLVKSTHGGVGDQCKDSQQRGLTLNIQKPDVYTQLSNLGNFNQQTTSPTFVGYGAQSISSSIAGHGVNMPQATSCSSNGLCSYNSSDVTYDWNSFNYNMLYNVNLDRASLFGSVCSYFDPS